MCATILIASAVATRFTPEEADILLDTLAAAGAEIVGEDRTTGDVLRLHVEGAGVEEGAVYVVEIDRKAGTGRLVLHQSPNP